MLRYLVHAQLDRARWDACVTQAPNGLLYGLSWYLDCVSPGWHGIVREEEGTYTAVMPVPVAYKFGLAYIRHPLFAHQLGVFPVRPLSSAEWLAIENLLTQQVRHVSSYSFNTGNHDLLPGNLPTFQNQIFSTFHLDLRQPYEQLKKGYRKDRRWRINKAKRAGLRVVQSTDLEMMIAIFKTYVAPRIPGIIGEAYEYKLLRQLYEQTQQRGMAQMFAALDAQGQEQAMGLFFFFNQKIIYIFNASTAQGKKLGAISLLLDTVLQKYAGEDWVFDFEAPEVGPIADFYSSFGSQPAPFLTVSVSHLPKPIQWLKQARMYVYRNVLNRQ